MRRTPTSTSLLTLYKEIDDTVSTSNLMVDPKEKSFQDVSRRIAEIAGEVSKWQPKNKDLYYPHPGFQQEFTSAVHSINKILSIYLRHKLSDYIDADSKDCQCDELYRELTKHIDDNLITNYVQHLHYGDDQPNMKTFKDGKLEVLDQKVMKFYIERQRLILDENSNKSFDIFKADMQSIDPVQVEGILKGFKSKLINL